MIEYYLDSFPEAGNAGKKSAMALDDLSDMIDKINIDTFGNTDRNAITKRNALSQAVRSLRNSLIREYSSTKYFKDAFRGLRQYVEKSTGKELNEYLSDNDILVNQTFADMSSVTGYTVDPENIES